MWTSFLRSDQNRTVYSAVGQALRETRARDSCRKARKSAIWHTGRSENRRIGLGNSQLQHNSELTVHNSTEQPNGIQGNGETGQILVTEKQNIRTCMYANCYIYIYTRMLIFLKPFS